MAERPSDNEPFVPKGAIAFFAVMILVYLGCWFAMYALLVRRG